MIGKRLGPYQILAKVGEGGMGEVYRARDAKLGRDVALKILPATFAEDVERLARFEREARTLAALNHPHIAQVYGFEEAASAAGPIAVRALVMELVEGDDLSARIARGPIPLDEALPIARQIGEALEAAHEAGIIHRDLKPANIKVRPDGTVKILDFGLAKQGLSAVAPSRAKADGARGAGELDSPTITSPAMTAAGLILGTAAYMAPEQAKGKPVDKRADIWAFGCVLYEMVTGRRPFDGEDITDTIAALVSKDPEWTRVPVPLLRLLQQCLQKDPRKRLRDIGDVWLLLDAARPASATTPAASGRRTAVLAGTAAIAALAAGALAFVHFSETAPPPPPLTRLHIALPAGATPDLNMQISPDGRRLAYLGRGSDGVVRVYLRAFDELDVSPVAGTEGTGSGSLFWSPDSRWLAFMNQQRLKKVDVGGGGSPQTIADVSGAPVIGGAWNRDGMIVIGSNPGGGRAGAGGLFKVSAAGGTITPITRLDVERQEMGHRFPTFLPDGRRFLYLRASLTPERSAIFVGDLDSTPEAPPSQPIVTTPAGPAVFMPSPGGPSATAGQLLFYRASALMLQPFDLDTLQLSGEPRNVAEPVGTFLDRAVFSASPTALVYTNAAGALDVQLRWYDAADQATGTPAGPPGAYTDLALSPDGTRAVVAISELERATRRSLWLLDFARDTRTRLTFNPGRDRSPLWSADGQSIIYVSDFDGSTIARKQATGEGNDEVLLKAPDSLTPTSLTQDGRFLAFGFPRRETRSPDLFVLPLTGPAERRKPYALAATPLIEFDPQISPDRRWVAYAAADQGSAGRLRSEIYVRPFPASGEAPPIETKWQVSSDGGGFPRWLAGGRQLSYVTGPDEARRIVVVDVVQTTDDSRGSGAFQWGAPRPLLSLPQGTTVFALTSDGKRLLAATPAAPNASPRPLTVVMNWLTGNQAAAVAASPP